MVRDTTAPRRWVFGNFQYNGKIARPDKWKNLVPLGVMWDEDPADTTNRSNPRPSRTIINTSLKGTIINPGSTGLPPTHLGWTGRLNGPVDNPMSSCYSCHSTAEYPRLAIMTPLFNPDTLARNPPALPAGCAGFRTCPVASPSIRTLNRWISASNWRFHCRISLNGNPRREGYLLRPVPAGLA